MTGEQRAPVQRVAVERAAPDGTVGKRGFDWRRHVIRVLVGAPGVWHRIVGAPTISARAIEHGLDPRRAPHLNPWRPRGAFEARRSAGVLYVRYLGTPLAPWAPEVGDMRELRHLWRLAPAPERWEAYASPDRLLALLGEGLASRPPRMDPSSPPPDATTAIRCSVCTWRPARGTAMLNGSQYLVCGVEPGHPSGFVPYDPLPPEQVHGEPEGDAPAIAERVAVTPATPPDAEPMPVFDFAGPAHWDQIARVLRERPAVWHRVDDRAYGTHTTRIRRGRIAALRGIEARTRDGYLELRAPKEA